MSDLLWICGILRIKIVTFPNFQLQVCPYWARPNAMHCLRLFCQHWAEQGGFSYLQLVCDLIPDHPEAADEYLNVAGQKAEMQRLMREQGMEEEQSVHDEL